ncbi:MAG: hypothetical protein EP332_03525 [Bacteroidetes bacterium]|nr:MAG: hypothetical protein EP332_03525 [Bacteroidota bacterium]
MFEPKEVNYVSDGRAMRHSAAGYIGTNKKNISLKEDGLVIKTFQVNNKYVDKFLNPTEELIELTAKHNDFDLPELAFIGLDSSQIIQRLGSASFFQEHALVYSYRNLALIFKLEMGKVLWLRYIKLAKPVLKENLAKELFTLTNQNHLSER